MNKNWLRCAALSSFVFFACTSTDTISHDSEGSTSEQSASVAGDTLRPLWEALSEEGVFEYFEAEAARGRFAFTPSVVGSNAKCSGKALKMDENTRYLDELESIYQEGELVDGVCGKALLLKDGEVAPLGVNLIDSMTAGTVEFWFHPGEDFYEKSARTLLGNDGARVHFFYKNGELIFQKNHADIHYFVRGNVIFNEGWNHIAGQWGDGYMSLWVNDEMIARMEHSHGYVPAMRDNPFENLLVIGYKSYCCMEGPGQREAMSTSGAFDQFRISNIPRYKMEDSVAVEPDTTIQDSVVRDSSIQDTTVQDTSVVDSVPADTTMPVDTLDCCSDTTVTDPLVPDTTISLWETLSRIGISEYFVSFDLPVVSTYQPNRCTAPALEMDDNTRYLDELESIYREGELVDGVCGKAVSLKDGEVAPLGINLIDSLKVGTVEFWFRPGTDFYKKSVRTLLGNDDSRMQILYMDGKLVFQKNHANRHYFVMGNVSLDSGWNLIAGQWGDGNMSIWLNGKKVASVAHEYGYVPATRDRPLENLLVIGFKSACCMEGIGLGEPLTASGAYDQLRISNIVRYKEDPEISFDHEYTGVTDTLATDDSLYRPIVIDTVGLPVVVDTTSLQ